SSPLPTPPSKRSRTSDPPMTSPLQLCIRRTPASGTAALGTRVQLKMPSEITCIEQAVSLVTRHCLSGSPASDHLRFPLQVALARGGQLLVHDASPPVARPDGSLDALRALVGGPVRLWRFDGRGLRPSAGGDPGWTPPVPRAGGLVPTPTGSVRLDPVPGIE